jgi:deoxyribonuclease V
VTCKGIARVRCRDDLDLEPLILQAVSQIPQGMVSTYGDIARALGDVRASRAVGNIISDRTSPAKAPCHRVIYADGRVGGGGRDEARNAELLASEGIPMEGGKVLGHRFTNFEIEPVLAELREEQVAVGKLVIESDRLGVARTVAGLDVSYSGRRAFAAISEQDALTGEVVEERTMETEVRFPYIPTYLTYREMPALRPLMDGKIGTIFLIDGQGTLHPRGAGIACHLGLCFDVPTIGAAKSALVGTVHGSGPRRPLLIGGQVRGYRLGAGRVGTFVSVGHRVSLDTAVEICERFLDRGIPSPLRRAHDLAGLARRERG